MDKLLERIYDDERKSVIKGLSFSKNKKIRVMPIPKSGGWMPRNSEGDVLKNEAKVRFTVPYNTRSKMYIDPLGHLTEKDKDKLAEELGLTDHKDFNPLKPGKDNYWKNREVVLDGNGEIYETTNAAHYIDVCILLTNYEFIAPSWTSRKDKATYLYALVDSEAEQKEHTKKSKTRFKAHTLFNDIHKSSDKLESVLWVRYWEKKDYPQPPDRSKEHTKKSKTRFKAHTLFNDIHKSSDKLESVLWVRYWEKKDYPQPPDRPNYDYLFSQVQEMSQDKPSDFIDIVGDGNFDIKADIVKGLK